MDQDHSVTSDLYGEQYYRSHLATGSTELRYERNDHWLSFFGRVADDIITRLQPRTVYDAGCAMGMLVEALRKRGVDACGSDVSEYAISNADPSVADHVRVGNLLDGIPGRFDLVTCIEVIEHLPPGDAPAAVRMLTEASDQVLLSTTPDDFAEPTHLNVQPPEYWAELFAEQNFFRDPDFDASFITPWACLLRRGEPSVSALVREREEERWRLVRERDALRRSLTELTLGSDAPPEEPSHRADLDDAHETILELRGQLRAAIDAAHGADAERATAAGRLRHVEYALDLAKQREEETEDIIQRIHTLTGGDRRKLDALLDARTFHLYWKLLRPYYKLRGGG